MKIGFLTTVTILIAGTASVWSQEPQPPMILTSAELQAETAKIRLAPLPENGAMPRFVAEPSDLGKFIKLVNFEQPVARQPQFTGGPSYYGRGNRFWGSAEALQWWTSPGNSPPLVTSGTPASFGALGPETTTLFGDNLNSNERWGGRFTLGGWLDSGQTRGIEAGYFFLGSPANSNFSASSDGSPGSPILARPFFNVNAGLQDSQLISFPDFLAGTVGVASNSFFQGAQLNMLWNLCGCNNTCCGCCDPCGGGSCCDPCGPACVPSGYRVDMTGGFTYFQLNENLVIAENLTELPTSPFNPGQTTMVTDSFVTRNNFYGGQIGLRAERYRGPWFVNVMSNVALGSTHQEVRINGSTSFDPALGAPNPQQGGLLALPSNIGNYSRDVFTVAPQINFNVGRQMTRHLDMYVGYTFMYWSNVVRAGDQIDPNINPLQLPQNPPAVPPVTDGPPFFAFHGTGFWAQGINYGLRLRW